MDSTALNIFELYICQNVVDGCASCMWCLLGYMMCVGAEGSFEGSACDSTG